MLQTVDTVGRLKDVAGLLRKTATVVILDPSERVPGCFVRAMEGEFPWISVERAASAEELCGDFANLVPLMLVSWDSLADVRDAADRITRKHSGSIIAAIHDENSGQMSDALASGFIRSVLPMNLRLDIWLSVVRLMLLGGEYFPRSVLHITAGASAAPISSQRRVGSGKALTLREGQVMDLLSRGFQNKHIAAELGVSENTVKIHLHNIIAKLGASNRTAAAAIYLDSEKRNAAALAGRSPVSL
jgi:DNA-binding NarL/FixJ family response regulator